MLKLANEEHSLEDIELQVSILVELEKVIAFPPMALTITSTLTLPTPKTTMHEHQPHMQASFPTKYLHPLLDGGA